MDSIAQPLTPLILLKGHLRLARDLALTFQVEVGQFVH